MCRHNVEKKFWAPAGVAQWIERQPVTWKIAGSIPGQGICLGCESGPRMGACERQPTAYQCFYSSFSPSPPLCLKINENL